MTVFLTTLGLIGMAEMGDKTQLAYSLLTAQAMSVPSVWLGSVPTEPARSPGVAFATQQGHQSRSEKRIRGKR